MHEKMHIYTTNQFITNSSGFYCAMIKNVKATHQNKINLKEWSNSGNTDGARHRHVTTYVEQEVSNSSGTDL